MKAKMKAKMKRERSKTMSASKSRTNLKRYRILKFSGIALQISLFH
jgi:hypothetical protein